jgi:hypothetical protein
VAARLRGDAAADGRLRRALAGARGLFAAERLPAARTARLTRQRIRRRRIDRDRANGRLANQKGGRKRAVFGRPLFDDVVDDLDGAGEPQLRRLDEPARGPQASSRPLWLALHAFARFLCCGGAWQPTGTIQSRNGRVRGRRRDRRRSAGSAARSRRDLDRDRGKQIKEWPSRSCDRLRAGRAGIPYVWHAFSWSGTGTVRSSQRSTPPKPR